MTTTADQEVKMWERLAQAITDGDTERVNLYREMLSEHLGFVVYERDGGL